MQDGSRREGQWKDIQMLGEGRDVFKDDRPSKGWEGDMLGLTYQLWLWVDRETGSARCHDHGNGVRGGVTWSSF